MTALPEFLLDRHPLHPPGPSKHVVSVTFLDKGIHRLSRIVQSGYAHWDLAQRDSVLHRLDARVKVLFVALFLVIVSLKRTIAPEAGIAAFVLALFLASRLDVLTIYKRVLAVGLVFGVLVPFPAMFNFLSDGEPLFPVVHLARPYELWGYHLPQSIVVTREGLHGIAMLFLRVTNSVALTIWLMDTTPFTDIAKALRMFRVPDTFVMVITLSYKYLFVFTRTVEEIHLAKKSRLLGKVRGREARSWAAERMTFLYRKTQMRYEEIFKVMVARGFTGDVKLYGLRRAAASDWWAAGAALGAGVLFLRW